MVEKCLLGFSVEKDNFTFNIEVRLDTLEYKSKEVAEEELKDASITFERISNYGEEVEVNATVSIASSTYSLTNDDITFKNKDMDKLGLCTINMFVSENFEDGITLNCKEVILIK